jgi:hypothetical protein
LPDIGNCRWPEQRSRREATLKIPCSEKQIPLFEQKDSLFHGVQGIACKALERLRN